MNDETRVIDDRQLARLVDGELTRSEYREVLRSLDDSNDGWRRCALAFLEAQALSEALGPAGQSPAADSPQTSESLIVSARRSHVWPVALAAAASFLLAFGLGLVVRHALQNQFDSPGNPMMASVDGPSVIGTPNDAGPKQAAGEAIPSFNGAVRLVVDDGRGQRREVELPVRGFDPSSTTADPMAGLPPALVDVVERMGHDVDRHEQFVPVALDDGSHLVIPVEHMRIVPVSRKYQ
ncbi:MAG: hypothetical protein KDA59_12865 [Planctomycetales bacterium]|nr:hypothetical protein [Planctomycetales bacterium]